ncbi:hypothetical protein LCGC14_0635540 [marine sediment metagenome]|uniref:Uncharacterized protein n=1 Tax=marine sediment metagenome TaxID=412755 RepID=A0A0F9R601_9ZZZZ
MLLGNFPLLDRSKTQIRFQYLDGDSYNIFSNDGKITR